MSHQEKVIIKIKKDGSGQMSFELDGFIGEGCDVIKQIEQSMGMITHTEETADAHLYENPDPAYNELST